MMDRPSVHPVASDYGDEDKYGIKAAMVGLGYDWYNGADPYLGIVLNPWDWGYDEQQIHIAAAAEAEAAAAKAAEEAAEEEDDGYVFERYRCPPGCTECRPRPLEPVKEEEAEDAEEEAENPFRPYSWQTGEAPVEGGFGAVGAYGWEDGEDVYMGLLLWPGEEGYEEQQAAIAAGAAAKAAAAAGGGCSQGKDKKD